jgi:hypothetical protein
METTIIYDAHIQAYSNGNRADNNYGKTVELAGMLANPTSHILLRWDVGLDSLREFKLLLSISKTKLILSKSGVEIKPTNINMKFDLYSLNKTFDEHVVTWNSAPKTELLKKDFVSVFSNQGSGVATLNLLPYIDFIENGIMLKLNDFFLSDAENKYPEYTARTGEDYQYVNFHSSESQNPPILIYDYGIKPPQPKITSPIWGAIINKKTTPVIRFDWESRGQTNYIFEYSQDGQNWTSKTGATAKYYNLSTNELGDGNLYVRVKIKADNIWSDYSQTWFLQIGEKPNTPIISLTGATTSTPKINWNANPLQYMYQVQVLHGTSLIEDSGELKGGAINYNLKTRLENGKTYTFKVRIADKYEIWSDWATNTTTISFVKPPKPVITLYPQPNRGSILIDIENPKPGTGEETTVYNEVFRKEEDGEWIRIASNVNKRHVDYTAKSEAEYQYKVRAIGQNGYNDSNVKIADVKVRYSDIAIVGEWDRYIRLKYNDTKRQNTGYSGEILKFAGRAKPVVEFEDTYDSGIALSFEITSKEELGKLQEIIDSRRTLLYRDSRGRKLYGNVVSRLDVEDLKLNHYRVSFTFVETDYSEVI